MKKRICIVVTTPLYVNFFLRNHIKALSSIYDVEIVTNYTSDDLSSLDDLNLSKVIYLPIAREIHLIKDVVALIKLISIIAQRKYDVVHSLTPKAGLLASIASVIHGKKHRIHTFTGQIWASRTGVMRIVLKQLDKLIASLDSIVLVDGFSQRQFLIEEKVIKPSKSFVLANGSISGVDCELFKANQDVREALRARYAIAHDDVVFLFLGRLKVDKGLLELVDAFEKLQRSMSNAKLVFVGYDEDQLVSSIKQRLPHSFIYCGSTTKPYEMIQMADVFCMPSHREGFGSSVIEASCASLPVICSDIYGLKDAFIHNQTGIKCKVKDIDSLYQAMCTLAADPSLRIQMGEAGYRYVSDHFDAKRVTQAWVDFYNKLLQQ